MRGAGSPKPGAAGPWRRRASSTTSCRTTRPSTPRRARCAACTSSNRRIQAKLVRVLRGEIFDVAVDVRVGSPWFGKHCGVVLSESNRRVFYVPEGFAHGFYVMSEKAEFVYKCSNYYSPPNERGIRWNDPALGISWPLSSGKSRANCHAESWETEAPISRNNTPKMSDVRECSAAGACPATMRMKSPNLSMTKPRPIRAMAVRCHASSVRSAAK